MYVQVKKAYQHPAAVITLVAYLFMDAFSKPMSDIPVGVFGSNQSNLLNIGS
jgi:hypothetical protein